MDNSESAWGKLNPEAPRELARFAFLVGRWRCEASLKMDEGKWVQFHATWVGRFILDGYAIADEYRMMNSAGDLIVLGLNVRSYNAAGSRWQIRWLNAKSGAWTDLASDELGGVVCGGNSITYAFTEPTAGHPYTRAKYTVHSADHFTWRGEESADAQVWDEFMVVEAVRVKENL